MNFYELFETIEDRIEKRFKCSTDWHWEQVQDSNTHEWKPVARCYFSDSEDIFYLLKKAGIAIQDKFYVKGIGKLKLNYNTQLCKYYVELIEKANVDIMLT